jgi:hypothetical protein
VISLTDKFSKIIENNETEKDDMCPSSYSIYGHRIFDDLLEQLKPKIEKFIGEKVYPTYSYARWYLNGESLFKHKDRESCEISLTLTLDYEGELWPFYVADLENGVEKNTQSVNIDKGCAVLYKGMEKLHWRDTYQGNKQVQVFLHYVKQKGEFADWKFDKRQKLSHH